eukprot:scaffold1588_cov214-Alexandrium_tamarense.AAC.25
MKHCLVSLVTNITIDSRRSNGYRACFGNDLNIADNSCNGERTCAQDVDAKYVSRQIGESSCNGVLSCIDVAGNVSAGSCNGDEACSATKVDIGAGSCNGLFACLGGDTSTIGKSSCISEEKFYDDATGDAFDYRGVCQFNSGTIDDESCVGNSSCYRNTGYIQGPNSW